DSYKQNNKYIIDAYERLLLESMRGIQSLFVSRDEIEESWTWIDSIISAWKKERNYIPKFYTSGTRGSNISDFI
ncbi:MAG: glucose-6-phosphate dehydrogenase, partial [Buchnera aphidicola]|nr:glucose-6-phosphate dehydrogenase [Buchnera aphidicola]